MYEDIDKNDLISRINSLDSVQRPAYKNLLQQYGKLHRYYRLKKKGKEEKIIKKYESRKLEYPSYYSERRANRTADVIQLYLRNRGYFDAKVDSKSLLKDKSAINIYNIGLDRLIRVDTLRIEYPEQADILKRTLELDENSSLLGSGSVLSKRNALDEYDRISNYLRNHGYAYFSKQNIEASPRVKATSTGKYNVDLKILNDPSGETTRKYDIGNVFINRFYRSGSNERFYFDQVESDSIVFYERPDLNAVRRRAILRKIEFRPGQEYSEYLVRKTRRRLQQFRFYQNPIFNLSPNDQDSSLLDVNILLTSTRRYEIGANLDLNYILDQANNNLWGFSLNGRFTDYNFLGSGEVLSASLNNEFQFNIGNRDINAGNTNLVIVNPRLQLDIPRFYNYLGLYSLTKSLKIGGYNFLELMEDFGTATIVLDYQYNEFSSQLRSSLLKATAGYRVTWPNRKNNVAINHIKFEYFVPERLEDFDDSNPLRNRNFTQTLFTSAILSDILYGYDSDPQNQKKLKYTHSSFLDFSGLEVMLLEGLSGGDTLRAFGDNEFARYFKLDQSHVIDIALPAQTNFVTRLNYGLAIPLGNSGEVPFVKQFGLGGSNSMRAWNYRELGVGSFRDREAENLADSSNFFYQSGDIKLELNLEYRFPVIQSAGFPIKIDGAFFTDIGNIWSIADQNETPGSQFSSDFISELAVGAGGGLRFDLTFFILRFELAWKLRQGFIGDNGRRSTGNDLFDSFSEGPRFVFGVGYPF